jgi:SAM-dependent methyltransferase
MAGFGDAGFGDFVLAWLPPAPARVLEVGCGREGGVVALLAGAGYDVLGVDPDAPAGERFRRETFQTAAPSLGTFDAIVAGRMLHHVDPLDDAVELLAALAPRLVVDEFAWEAIDPAAQAWYERRHAELSAAGAAPGGPPTLDEWRWRHPGLHQSDTVLAALRKRYDNLVFEPLPYLHRWLGASEKAAEQALVDGGTIPPTGWRWAGARA